MDQLERTRRRCLDQARSAEEKALALTEEAEQDAILDITVWLRVVANLPSYKKK